MTEDFWKDRFHLAALAAGFIAQAEGRLVDSEYVKRLCYDLYESGAFKEETMNKSFIYYRSADGCDETWDILYPGGAHLVSIHFWERAKETQAEAELIVKALNHYIGTEDGARELAKCLRINSPEGRLFVIRDTFPCYVTHLYHVRAENEEEALERFHESQADCVGHEVGDDIGLNISGDIQVEEVVAQRPQPTGIDGEAKESLEESGKA